LGDAARAGNASQNSGMPAAEALIGAEELTLLTADGERLAARHYPAPGADQALNGGVGVVVAHGFTGSIDKPHVRNVSVALARHAGVLAFDFRGHGRSSGHSTLGDREIADLEAAVQALRERGYRQIVTCGWSMGGSVVLRHAALIGGVDAVVSVSAVSRWFYRGTAAMRRLHWAIETRVGRLLTRRVLRTRVSAAGWPVLPEAPIDVVARISPIPLLLVHGDRDHYFPVEHPQALFDTAQEPKELWLVEGFGHAESGATPELLDRIGTHLPALLALAP